MRRSVTISSPSSPGGSEGDTAVTARARSASVRAAMAATSAEVAQRLDAKTLDRVDALAVDCVWLAEQLKESGIDVRRLVLAVLLP